MKKNYRPYLFIGLGLFAMGLGFFSANSQIVKEVKAEENGISFDGSTITLGSYPNRVISEYDWGNLNANATLVGIDKYEYEGKYYTRVDNCQPGVNSGTLEGTNGLQSVAMFEKDCWFEWKEIIWLFVKEENNVSYFYTSQIIDTARWQSGSYSPANDWEHSTIREFLNNTFIAKAFSNEEQSYLYEFTNSENTSKKNITDKVTLMTKSELSKHTSFIRPVGTHYAVAKSLFAKYTTDGTPLFYYYLNSIDNTTNDNEVDIARGDKLNESFTTNDTKAQEEVGVRPMIAISNDNLIRKSGGSGSGSSGTGMSGNIVVLILGIVFTLLGAAGITTFFLLWKKGKLIIMAKVGSGKLPIGGIVVIGLCITITIAGTCMLFACTGGVGTGYSATSPVGYWSATDFSLDTNSDEFGYSYYLGLTKDHKVYRYHGEYGELSGLNQILHPYPGIGSWYFSGKDLVIEAAPTWNLLSWEEATTKYYAVDISGKRSNAFGYDVNAHIMNYGDSSAASYVVKGYRWAHISKRNPTGEAVELYDIQKDK